MSETTMPSGSRENYKKLSVKRGPKIEAFKFIIAGMETRISDEKLKSQVLSNDTSTSDGTSDATANNDKEVTVSSIIIRNLPDITIDAERFAEVLNDKESYKEGSLKGKSKDNTQLTQEQGRE